MIIIGVLDDTCSYNQFLYINNSTTKVTITSNTATQKFCSKIFTVTVLTSQAHNLRQSLFSLVTAYGNENITLKNNISESR